jgi:hypothetical protein
VSLFTHELLHYQNPKENESNGGKYVYSAPEDYLKKN